MWKIKKAVWFFGIFIANDFKMSERILKALMQLFAIVAKIDVIEDSDEIVAADTSKNIVELF